VDDLDRIIQYGTLALLLGYIWYERKGKKIKEKELENMTTTVAPSSWDSQVITITQADPMITANTPSTNATIAGVMSDLAILRMVNGLSISLRAGIDFLNANLYDNAATTPVELPDSTPFQLVVRNANNSQQRVITSGVYGQIKGTISDVNRRWVLPNGVTLTDGMILALQVKVPAGATTTASFANSTFALQALQSSRAL